MRTCSFCKQQAPEEAIECPFCGHAVIGQTEPQNAPNNTNAGNLSLNNPSEINGDESPAVENNQQEIAQSEFFIKLSESTRHTFITPTLLAVNVVVFVLMAVSGVGVFEPTYAGLIGWGADYGPYTSNGEWWRIITNTYIHIGIIHLALNMWCLLSIGFLVERLFGNLIYLLIYTTAGIVGSIVSLSVHPVIISAGASGAIFGLYGALLGYCLRQKHQVPKTVLKELRNSTLGFIAYNLFNGFIHSGIDNSAHIGGLLCGTVLGFSAAMPINPIIRNTINKKCIFVTLVVIATTLFVSASFLMSMPWYKVLDIQAEIVAADQKIAEITQQIAKVEESKNTAKDAVNTILHNTQIDWPSSIFDRNDDLVFYNKTGYDLHDLKIKMSFHTDLRSETTLEFVADCVRANDNHKWADFIKMTSSEHNTLHIDSWTEDSQEFLLPARLQTEENNLVTDSKKWNKYLESKISELRRFTWSGDKQLKLFAEYAFNADRGMSLKPADQENAQAQRNIGNAYYFGNGVAEDKAEAVKWWHKAADQGDDQAQCWLGYCYQNGEGVSIDTNEAVKWYRKAADQGNSTASQNLKSLGL